MNDPYLIIDPRSVFGQGDLDPNKAIWIDSISDCCRVVWANSEDSEIADVEGALQIGPFDKVDTEIESFLGNDPFIWISDYFCESDHVWCDDRNLTTPSLLVEVSEVEGITRRDIELADAFLDYLGVR